MKKLLKYGAAALMLVLLMDATGCQLARPERAEGQRDQFVGFHIVPEQLGEMIDENGEIFQQIGDNDRSAWVEYGTENLELEGFGSVSFPRQILIGTYDEEERRYIFPGKEGYNCFIAMKTEEDGSRYLNGYTDMSHSHLEMKVTDEGEEHILTSALYVEPHASEADMEWILTAYRVYQMADGTVYLDGTGNSYGGPGFTITEKEEYTTTINGESTQEITSVEFSLKDAPNVQKLRVLWFDGDAVLIGQEELSVKEVGEEHILTPPAGAVWALAEETNANDTVTRTAFAPDHDGWASHELILLDDRGIGRRCYLRWELP